MRDGKVFFCVGGGGGGGGERKGRDMYFFGDIY